MAIGKRRPLRAGALDGTLLRVPDTPANRAFFGTVGTGDDSGPYPCLRALPLTCCSCRALFAMPHGAAGTDKAAAEQKLLDEAMECFPCLLDPGWIWLMDRNYHGAPRIARMIACTHVLICLKSDIPLKRTSPILPDGSCHSRRRRRTRQKIRFFCAPLADRAEGQFHYRTAAMRASCSGTAPVT